MTYPKYEAGEGLIIPNLFGPYDARLLRRSFEHNNQKVHLRVGSYAPMYAKWTAFLAEHPGSWSELAKCPTKEIFDAGAWAYRVKATGASGSSKTVLLSGNGDPGYKFTAWGLAEAGLCLAQKTEGCLSEKGGAWAYRVKATGASGASKTVLLSGNGDP